MQLKECLQLIRDVCKKDKLCEDCKFYPVCYVFPERFPRYWDDLKIDAVCKLFNRAKKEIKDEHT